MLIESAINPIVINFPHRPYLTLLKITHPQYNPISSMTDKNLVYVALKGTSSEGNN